MKPSSVFAALLLLALLISCKPQNTFTADTILPDTRVSPVTSKIVFLFFEIQKNEAGKEIITHTGTTTAEGVAKEKTIENQTPKSGNIVISFLKANGDVLSQRILEDPLNPEVETYSPDGLNREKLKLNKAEFSIRFNQAGDIATVRLEKITPTAKTHLYTLKL